MHLTSFRGIVAALAFLGCQGGTEPLVCLDYAQMGLVITVSDHGSGAPLSGASGTAREGEYVEVLEGFDHRLYGAEERPGVYRIEVTRAGYSPWVRQGVRVSAGRCHVQPVLLEARLELLP